MMNGRNSVKTLRKRVKITWNKAFCYWIYFKFFNDIFEFALFSFKIKIIESSGFGMNEIEASGDLTLENNQELFPLFLNNAFLSKRKLTTLLVVFIMINGFPLISRFPVYWTYIHIIKKFIKENVSSFSALRSSKIVF